MFISSFTSMFITLVMALVSMAFYTLIERKALGYIQIRKGPNKPSISGLLVPFADAAKLFSKEKPSPYQANSFLFFVAPSMALMFSLMIWSLYPSQFPHTFFSYSTLAFLAISSMSVYPTMGAGWLSNSKYSLIGAFRSIAQTISYEVSMALVFISLIVMFSSTSLAKNFILMPLLISSPMIVMFWLLTIHAETNRTPFDFAEGESELVSGFNTEYSAGTFALIFMAEYLAILGMSMVSFYIMLPYMSGAATAIMIFAISFLFIWTRGSLPRLRYDSLMYLTWKNILPATLLIMLLTICIL